MRSAVVTISIAVQVEETVADTVVDAHLGLQGWRGLWRRGRRCWRWRGRRRRGRRCWRRRGRWGRGRRRRREEKAWSTVSAIRAQRTRSAIHRGYISAHVNKVRMGICRLRRVVADSIEQVEACAAIGSGIDVVRSTVCSVRRNPVVTPSTEEAGGVKRSARISFPWVVAGVVAFHRRERGCRWGGWGRRRR